MQLTLHACISDIKFHIILGRNPSRLRISSISFSALSLLYQAIIVLLLSYVFLTVAYTWDNFIMWLS